MDVAVAFYAGDFAAEPIWRLKLSTRRAIWEFHFSHDEAFVFPTIDVDLDYEISPRNFVARLLQPPADRSVAEHGELFRAQFDLACVADISAHKFEGERQVAAFFSKPHMSIVRLGDEITLRDFEISSAFQIRRQTFDQKLPFDLAIIFLIHSFERCCQPYFSENDAACNRCVVPAFELRMVRPEGKAQDRILPDDVSIGGRKPRGIRADARTAKNPGRKMI